MKLYIASDHAGFEAKKMLSAFLESRGFELTDLGPDSDASVDYPYYANKLIAEVLKNMDSRGILICGTGIGMSIAANRHKGIRAALCTSMEMAELSRRHNDANVLCMGGRTTPISSMREIALKWLSTPFEGGRHLRRINQIDS